MSQKEHILENRQIRQKMLRIAYQLLENSTEFRNIHLIGIQGNGFALSGLLKSLLEEHGQQEIQLSKLEINKENPGKHPILILDGPKNPSETLCVLVDDVLNSGRTMQYALIPILQLEVAGIKTVALVDRRHRKYPIKCDFVGLSLSTTLQERVEVVIDSNEQISAFLT
ncbi:MAG: phosphoribosyltransferase [Bacteroidetes bacterium]|nr:MAG: phosphoribosyltransferase [Bacteroidota bacterium]